MNLVPFSSPSRLLPWAPFVPAAMVGFWLLPTPCTRPPALPLEAALVQMLEIAPYDPMEYARLNASRMTDAEVECVIGPCRRSASRLAQGCGDRKDWLTLCSALTVGRAVETGGVVRGMTGHFNHIEKQLLKMADRAGENLQPKRWKAPALWFEEIEAIRLLVDLHKTQMAALSYGEYRRAFELAVARVQSAHGEAVNLPTDLMGRVAA